MVAAVSEIMCVIKIRYGVVKSIAHHSNQRTITKLATYLLVLYNRLILMFRCKRQVKAMAKGRAIYVGMLAVMLFSLFWWACK